VGQYKHPAASTVPGPAAGVASGTSVSLGRHHDGQPFAGWRRVQGTASSCHPACARRDGDLQRDCELALTVKLGAPGRGRLPAPDGISCLALRANLAGTSVTCRQPDRTCLPTERRRLHGERATARDDEYGQRSPQHCYELCVVGSPMAAKVRVR